MQGGCLDENSTKSGEWEGLGRNAAISIGMFLVMMVAFVIVRRKAWNNRSRQLTRTHKGWLQFIYGDREAHFTNPDRHRMLDPHHHDMKKQGILVPPSLVTGYNITEQPLEAEDDNLEHSKEEFREKMPLETWRTRSNKGKEYNTEDIERQERKADYFAAKDQLTRSMSTESVIQFGYWLLDVLLIRDKEIARLKGIDAVQYLTFQRYIIYFLTFLTFASLSIVLPVNIFSTSNPKAGFFRTTIFNIEKTHVDILYLHVILSMALLLIGWLVMRHFSNIINTEDDKVSERTLLIQKIPKGKLVKADLEAFLTSKVSDIVIQGIQFVYDTRVVKALYSEYVSVKNAKYYCEEYLAEFRERFEGRPYICGQWLGLLCCCYCFPKVDGLAHYTERMKLLEKDIEKNYELCISNPTGGIFITLETEEQAVRVYRFIQAQRGLHCPRICCCFDFLLQFGRQILNSLATKKTDHYEVAKWEVSFAPYPDDINWDDIAVDFRMVWLRRIGVNVWLFLIFFFFSTPAILDEMLRRAGVEKAISTNLEKFTPFLRDYIPAFITLISTTTLPTVVAVSSYLLPYGTISERDYSVMWKTFVFLILMLIIIPAFGATSLETLLSRALEKDNPNWKCVFQSSGTTQLNYVIQAMLVGNAMEVLRFPELFLYLFYMNFSSQTIAEYEYARQQVVFDFSFGLRYPKFLLVFSIVSTYSLMFPLIAPFGLIYMVFKHVVDRYNIYYVYTPSRIPGNIHSAAMMFFYICLLLMELQLFAFTYSVASESKRYDIILTSMVGLLLSSVLVLYHCFNRWFSSLRIVKCCEKDKGKTQKAYQEEFCACAYAPEVLYDLNAHGIVPLVSGSRSKELTKSKKS